MKRVVLGLSGGVDSAVAATLLQQAGYAVHGHFLDMGLGGEPAARAVAEQLGIPFTSAAVGAKLEEEVCQPFAAAYLSGETPIPCARCNQVLKFPALLEEADALGADFVATGHYARTQCEGGQVFLAQGRPANDQAYMLARLTGAQLARVLFPLGDYEKTEVRALARSLGLFVAEKPDSMEICFIPDDDYAAWIARRGAVPPPGNFVDEDGNILGRHQGIHHYTRGQRRGLGIAAAHRLFVSALRPESNEVVLSDGRDLFSDVVYAVSANVYRTLADGDLLQLRIRHSKQSYAARLYHEEGGLRFMLDTPARAPTAGQLAVFYEGERVLGSAYIVDCLPAADG